MSLSWGLFPFLVFVVGGVAMFSMIESSIGFSVLIMEMGCEALLFIDFLSLVFLVVVGLVSTAVLFYSVYYMEGSTFKVKFMITMLIFISSMFLLSMSADLFWVMVGWDGLGLSSLALIMFFQNWKSFNSSMVTFLSNRLGDALIIVSLVWFLGAGVTNSSSVFYPTIFTFFLLFGAFSKSAQVPFSAWLPLAMAAPTPVSSLVHSSTLVTAGVYLLLRFNGFLSETEKTLIYFISVVTVLLAASSSMGEYDLKKVIALSTLSHIGLMMMFISQSSFSSVLIHLHSHAMFKSLLFMIAGDLIHKSNNSQDIRNLSISQFDFPTGVALVVSLLSMIGFPFMAGFYSKELFLSISSGGGFGLIVSFLLAASLTASYSFRILFSLFSNHPLQMSKIEFSPNWVVFSAMSLFSLMSGGIMLMISKVENLEVFPLYPPLFSLKKEIFLLLLSGMGVGMWFSLIQGSISPFFLKWIHQMWWISSVCFFFQSKLFTSSWKGLFKFDTKGLIDSMFSEKKILFKSTTKSILEKIIPFPILLVGWSFILLLGVSLGF